MTELELNDRLNQRADLLRQYVERRIPRRVRRTVATEDVLQEIWITVFRSIGSFCAREADSFDRWLMTIARTRLLNAIRYANQSSRAVGRLQEQNDKSGSYLALFAHLASAGRTPSSEHACDEAVRAIRSAIDILPDDYRRVITMLHIEGKTQAEVATVMQKTTAAVNGLLYRGMIKLKSSMGWDGQYFNDSDQQQPK